MSTEFKKIISNNETYYVLEDASAGATSAGAVASVAAPLGSIRRRIKKLREKVEKVSVPKAKPRNPAGMGSNPGRGTKVHKNKRQDQKVGKEKHKKPFYENLLDEINTIADIDAVNELSTNKLAQYKKAAGKDASAADKAGDYERGNKRFRGIVKATKKQFSNDSKSSKGMTKGTEIKVPTGMKENISWSSLDEGLSIEDKMSIFEEFCIKGNLTESTNDDKKNYFISLFDLSDAPKKGEKYIVAPLALISNRIMILNKPQYMKFVGKGRDGLVFSSSTGNKTYPSKVLRELSISNAFTFASVKEYDKFRTALYLKFDTKLPEINLLDREGVAEATGDEKFDSMMGNIVGGANDTPVTGYVAVSYGNESRSKKIIIARSQIEDELFDIGEEYGWDSIDDGHGEGYDELFFETNTEYTSATQRQLALNIVNTVNDINEFFEGLNRSLQAIGLPVYEVSVWQGMGDEDDTNKYSEIADIINIANGNDAKPNSGQDITEDDREDRDEIMNNLVFDTAAKMGIDLQSSISYAVATEIAQRIEAESSYAPYLNRKQHTEDDVLSWMDDAGLIISDDDGDVFSWGDDGTLPEEHDLAEAHPNSKIYDKCWTGYRKVPGKKRGEAGSCKKISEDEYIGQLTNKLNKITK